MRVKRRRRSIEPLLEPRRRRSGRRCTSRLRYRNIPNPAHLNLELIFLRGQFLHLLIVSLGLFLRRIGPGICLVQLRSLRTVVKPQVSDSRQHQENEQWFHSALDEGGVASPYPGDNPENGAFFNQNRGDWCGSGLRYPQRKTAPPVCTGEAV